MVDAETGPIVTTTINHPIAVMNEDMFGAIANNQFGWNYYTEHREEFGLTNIRFPGGTVSEEGWVIDGRIRLGHGDKLSLDTLDGDRSQFAFDLTHPELIAPSALLYDEQNFLNRDDVATFSQVLAEAVEHDVDVSLIIPIERYFRGADLSDTAVRERAIAAAEADLEVFLERLKNGEYNQGEYPETIVFDIGNETFGQPIETAVITKVMIDTIEEELADSEISYEIGVQMGRGEYEYVNLRRDGYFDRFVDGSHELIEGLDELDFTPGDYLTDEQRQTAIDEMMISILGPSAAHIDALRHHLLGFNPDRLDAPEAPLKRRGEIVELWMDSLEELGVASEDIDYYISAFTTNTANGNGLPFAMPGAANTLEVYDLMLRSGATMASIWGVVGAFRYKDTIANTTVSDRLSKFDSPQAAILKLLSEHTMNSTYLGASGDDASGYRSFTYENETEYTVFLSVEELAGEYSISVDLGLLSDLAHVTAINLDLVDGAANGATRLTESELEVVDGRVEVTFDQDFEVAMLTLNKSESISYQTMQMIESLVGASVTRETTDAFVFGDETAEQLVGGTGSDIVLAGDGDDVVDGGAGRSGFFGNGQSDADFDEIGAKNGDFLFGGAGNDVIRGNAGNDLISGDSGDDHMWGGSGFDTFVFNEGSDHIHDFNPNVDRILIDQALVESVVDFADWLDDHAITTNGSIVLDFGAGNQLTVSGLTDQDELFNRISLTTMDELSII